MLSSKIQAIDAKLDTDFSTEMKLLQDSAVDYKSRPSLCRQEEKNSVRLFRVEPVNILLKSNTIKLVPFDWALNLVWFQICVRDSYLLRGIQNVNFNV